MRAPKARAQFFMYLKRKLSDQCVARVSSKTTLARTKRRSHMRPLRCTPVFYLYKNSLTKALANVLYYTLYQEFRHTEKIIVFFAIKNNYNSKDDYFI